MSKTAQKNPAPREDDETPGCFIKVPKPYEFNQNKGNDEYTYSDFCPVCIYATAQRLNNSHIFPPCILFQRIVNNISMVSAFGTSINDIFTNSCIYS